MKSLLEKYPVKKKHQIGENDDEILLSFSEHKKESFREYSKASSTAHYPRAVIDSCGVEHCCHSEEKEREVCPGVFVHCQSESNREGKVSYCWTDYLIRIRATACPVHIYIHESNSFSGEGYFDSSEDDFLVRVHSDNLEDALNQAVRAVVEGRSSWTNAKRDHFKAWSATDEIWPDEESRLETEQWEKNTHEKVFEAARMVNERVVGLEMLMKQAEQRYGERVMPEGIRLIIEDIMERNLLRRM